MVISTIEIPCTSFLVYADGEENETGEVVDEETTEEETTQEETVEATEESDIEEQNIKVAAIEEPDAEEQATEVETAEASDTGEQTTEVETAEASDTEEQTTAEAVIEESDTEEQTTAGETEEETTVVATSEVATIEPVTIEQKMTKVKPAEGGEQTQATEEQTEETSTSDESKETELEDESNENITLNSKLTVPSLKANANGLSNNANNTVKEIELWAHEPFEEKNTDMPQSVTVDLTTVSFTDSTGSSTEQLTSEAIQSQALTVEGVEYSGFSLANASSVDENKRTAGYKYSNSTFGITVSVGESESSDALDSTDNPSPVTMDETTNLTFTLHNANAITQDGEAGTLQLKLKIGEVYSSIIKITIHRYPTQINATIPLYVCMYGYGGDGKVVTPSSDAYSIVNNSNCPIQITSIQGSNSSWTLKDSSENLKAGELFLSLAGQVITSDLKSLAGNSLWRIAAPKDSEGDGIPCKIPIQAEIAGGSVNEDGEFKACTVTYTAGIPAD
jgi:hypothetical protein